MRQAPIDAPSRCTRCVLPLSQSPKMKRSSPLRISPFGPPAAAGMMRTSAGCSPRSRKCFSAVAPAWICKAFMAGDCKRYDARDEPRHHDHEHSELGEMDLRVRALETVLAQKGYIDPAALDVLIDTYQTKIGPRNGARVVARAWADAGLPRLAAARRHRGHRLAGLQRPPGRAHGGAGEHAAAAPHGRVHAVQLLPLAGAGPAAHLVQERALPLARGEGPARRARRLRRRRCPKAPRSASSIPPPKCATWCCRCALPAPRASAKSSWPSW